MMRARMGRGVRGLRVGRALASRVRLGAAVLAVAVAVGLAGCGGGAGKERTPGADEATTTAGGATSSGDATSSEGGGGAGSTEELLLARQVQLFEGGEGYLDCVDDLEVLPASYSTGPAVWISSGFSEPLEFWSPGLPYVTLCLNGFSADAPITITLEADDFRARTTAVPVPEPTVVYGTQSPYTLFEDGATLEITPVVDTNGVYDAVPPLLSSSYWSFLPPADALDAIGRSASVTVTAEQGGVTSTSEQPFTPPDQPGHALVYPLPVGDVRLLVWGYPAGAAVPVGLYSLSRGGDGSGPLLTLVEEIGTVVMPDYRIGEFRVPLAPLESVTPGQYCVLPPVDEDWSATCEQVWPAFPGEVRPGDEGDTVRRWERILVGAGFFGDGSDGAGGADGSGEAGDGVYGPAEVEEVRGDQEWMGLPVDGVLGVAFYAALTGALLPE